MKTKIERDQEKFVEKYFEQVQKIKDAIITIMLAEKTFDTTRNKTKEILFEMEKLEIIKKYGTFWKMKKEIRYLIENRMKQKEGDQK